MTDAQPGPQSSNAPDSFARQRARTRRFTLGRPRTIGVYADGARVLFLRAAGPEDPRTGLWAMDLPAGVEREVVAAADDEALSSAERARRERQREGAAGVTSYAADAAGATAAVILAGRLHVVDVDTGAIRDLDTGPEPFDPRPDPTGTRIAYLSGRELRVVELADGADRLLVAEDSPTVSWGRAEFVAGEEMNRYRGYWWSPDGAAILAARVDDAPLPQWWIADPAHPGQPPTPTRYPAAGSDPAEVSLWLLDVTGGADPVEVGWDRATYPYLGRAGWEGGDPLLQVVTRRQDEALTLHVDPATGAATELARDRDGAWVELFAGSPCWYEGQAARIADVDGARRLVVGSEPVTPPQHYVRSIVGAGTDGLVLTASERDSTSVQVLRWSRSGGLVALTEESGVHGAVVGGGTVVLTSTTLARQGTVTEVVTAGARTPLRSYAATAQVSPQQQLISAARGNESVRIGLLLPSDHVPGTKLPVLMDPYGGPHVQRVMASRDLWLEPQWIADQGFAVVVADNRGTPGMSPAYEKAIRYDLATAVLEDQMFALEAAAEVQPDLDLSRVGIRGWSFGGYLAALAVLRRPDVFHAAVAGAPVTDWTLYDTYYTERYLGLPQEHPEAYAQSSLLSDGPSLRRPLLLIHGLADDNVVSAHTLRLSQVLTEAGRTHSVLPLTGVTHMTPQEAVAENLLLLQVEFLRSHLGLPTSP